VPSKQSAGKRGAGSGAEHLPPRQLESGLHRIVVHARVLQEEAALWLRALRRAIAGTAIKTRVNFGKLGKCRALVALWCIRQIASVDDRRKSLSTGLEARD
jgi:hypothetical protein